MTLLLFFLYSFLLSISLIGAGLNSLGGEYARAILKATSNPFIGLIIGVFVTSIVQSSSSTTSIVVGMAAGGMLNLEQAVPIIMGANIGTTVTNVLVSLGYLGTKREFERAFAAAIVHDFFNILCVIIFFPMEISWGIISRSADFLSQIFQDIGGIQFSSPIKIIITPVEILLGNLLQNPWIILTVSVVMLFLSLGMLVKVMKSLLMQKLSSVFDKVIFRTPIIAFLVGLIFTSIIQSSSVTTSLVVPLAGAGALRLEQIFPYTLGANIGTTVTAILAALITQNRISIAVAFGHMLFNFFGTLVFFPLKFIPINLARSFAHYAHRSKIYPVLYILCVFFLIPFAFILLSK